MVCSWDTHTCTLEITASLYSMALPCPTFTKGDESERIRNVSDERIASQTVDILRILGIGNISNENILFWNVYRWEAVGPIISEGSYGDWSDVFKRPSGRIFLVLASTIF